MPRPVNVIKLNSSGDISAQIPVLQNQLDKLFYVLQGRVRFGSGTDGSEGDNISGEWQVVSDTGSADTEFSVAHTLGAVPIGYIVTKVSKGGVVYDSGTTWTDTTIYLKCSAANTNVSLFLIK